MRTDASHALLPDVAPRRAGDGFLVVLLLAYLSTLLFEGPLRFVLTLTPRPGVLYLRDLIPAGTLLFLFARSLWTDQRVDLALALPAAALALHAALAAIQDVSPFSIAFGLKIFMLVCWGIALGPLIRSRWRQALALATVIFWVTVCGVALGLVFGRMPWEAVEYQTTFGSLTTTRLWWITGGTPRLPGFMRTSFDAATVIGVTGMLAMLRVRSATAAWLLAAIALVAIAATTTKGMLLAFPLAAAWIRASSRPSVLRAAMPLLCVLSLLTFLIPVMTAALGPTVPSSAFPDLVLSVWDRMTQMWPEAFTLLPGNPLAVGGAGLGSIGIAQWYGHSPHLANSADSLAIYLVVSFGLLGAVYYFLPLLAVAGSAAHEDALVRRACIGVLIVGYAYGVAGSMVEEAFFAIVLGVCVGILFRSWRQAAERRPAMTWPRLQMP